MATVTSGTSVTKKPTSKRRRQVKPSGNGQAKAAPAADVPEGVAMMAPIDRIERSPFNPRIEFDPGELESLA